MKYLRPWLRSRHQRLCAELGGRHSRCPAHRLADCHAQHQSPAWPHQRRAGRSHPACPDEVMEIWKRVVGNDDYEISSLGRVKRVTTAMGATAGRILRPALGSHGYLGVHLGRHNGHLIHRLMAQAFLPPISGRTHVNHINGIKTDNRIENIERSNKSLNQLLRHGTRPLRGTAAQARGFPRQRQADR